MNPDSKKPKPSAPANPQSDDVELRIQKIQESAATLGQFVERVFVEVLRPAGAEYPLMQNEKFCSRLVRYCRPWPEWVLRIAAEVLAVRFPKVKKELLFDCLRSLHFLAVELRSDESNVQNAPPMPKMDDCFIGAIVGHLLAHFVRYEPTARATTSQPSPEGKPGEPVTPDQTKSLPTVDELQQQFVPMIASHFKDFPKGFLDFNSALAEAKAATFDEAGKDKETQLTPVYRKILSDWPEIECLSGPKALTEYLGPKLVSNRDFADRYERVKKICQRMRITFQPFVKGQ